MPKWFETWLKSRKEAHILIARLKHWQIKRKAEKEVKYAMNAAKKFRK